MSVFGSSNFPPTSLMRLLLVLGLTLTLPRIGLAQDFAEDAQVTILSSNLANGGAIGEWGLSAFVQVDGNCILFDAGRYPDTVIRNADTLGVDLTCVTDLVLSHFHFDHTTGILPLIETLRKSNPGALQRIHVADGLFHSRRLANGEDGERNQMIAMRAAIAAAGVEVLIHTEAAEILPSVWISGPVARRHPERNYGASLEVELEGDWVEDFVPESQALVIRTEQGPIVLLGCGHSGVVNALEQIQESIQNKAIHALMGGLHLFAASDQTLGWTADRLRAIGIRHLMAGHCTGIEPLYRLRAGLNLSRRTAVVGAVGSRFVLGEGIYPTAIAM